MTGTYTSVDEYIGAFPPHVQVVLREVRRTIHDAVPGAGEKISYRIPAITVAGKTVLYFAGWQRHISLYPLPATDADLAEELVPYKSGPGTVKFPLAQPVPYDLVGRLAALLAEQRAPEHRGC